MNLDTILNAIKDQLDTYVPGVTVQAYPVEQVHTPCLVLVPARLTYGDTFDGEQTLTVTIVAVVSRADMRAGFEQLAAWSETGEGTIPYALAQSTTFSGACDSHDLTGPLEFATEDIAGTTYLTGRWTVEVFG